MMRRFVFIEIASQDLDMKQHVHAYSFVSDSETSWTVAHQSPLSMGFSMARILDWVTILFSRLSS